MNACLASFVRIVAIAAMVLTFSVEAAWGQCLQKISPSDAGAENAFGTALALSGDDIIVGSPFSNAAGVESGAAYWFHYDGASWIEQQQLLPQDDPAGDTFGWSVAISGDTVLVGAPFDDDNDGNAGAAYVFRLNGGTWEFEQKLLADDGAGSDYFGYAVALSGNHALIGAYADDNSGSVSGSAYVFCFDALSSTWVQQDKLVASDGQAYDRFGETLAISGDAILIGAHMDDNAGGASGSVYPFFHDDNGTPGDCLDDTWIQGDKFRAFDTVAGDEFGCAISMEDDIAVIGAFGDDDAGSFSGSAYVFLFNEGTGAWVEEAKLVASDATVGDTFGRAVGVSGDTILVGAPGDDDHENASGSVYVFLLDWTSWVEEIKLLAPDGDMNDEYGQAVAVDQRIAVAGAPNEDAFGSDSGAAYVASGLTDCNRNGILDRCDIDAGLTDDCNNDGIPDQCSLCPPSGAVDIVFILDTSGSMGDEINALCSVVTEVIQELEDDGLILSSEILTVMEEQFTRISSIDLAEAGKDADNSDGWPRALCTEGSVEGYYGTTTPGLPELLGDCGGHPEPASEDWGPATAIVAANKTWTPGALRVIIPLSDEGPRCGDPVYDAGSDQDAIDHAIPIVAAGNVVVSPVIGSPWTQAVVDLAGELAAGGRPGGQVLLTTENPSINLADLIHRIIIDGCDSEADCNVNWVLDECDILAGSSWDCQPNGILDECEYPGCPGLLLGDMQCDGVVNGRDIPAFLEYFLDRRYLCQADINQDGAVDEYNLPSLVDLLLGIP